MSGQPEHTTARHSAGYRPDCPACQWADANLMEPVERADIPLETYWTDRTAALAEALHETGLHRDRYRPGPSVYRGISQEARVVTERMFDRQADEAAAKDALLYLREHGWTLEREER